MGLLRVDVLGECLGERLSSSPILNIKLMLISQHIELKTYGTFVRIVYCFPKILKKEKSDFDFLQEERIVR